LQANITAVVISRQFVPDFALQDRACITTERESNTIQNLFFESAAQRCFQKTNFGLYLIFSPT